MQKNNGMSPSLHKQLVDVDEINSKLRTDLDRAAVDALSEFQIRGHDKIQSVTNIVLVMASVQKALIDRLDSTSQRMLRIILKDHMRGENECDGENRN